MFKNSVFILIAAWIFAVALMFDSEECNGPTSVDLNNLDDQYQSCIGSIDNTKDNQALCRRLVYGGRG